MRLLIFDRRRCECHHGQLFTKFRVGISRCAFQGIRQQFRAHPEGHEEHYSAPRAEGEPPISSPAPVSGVAAGARDSVAVRPHPKAVTKIVDQAEQLLAFYDLPKTAGAVNGTVARSVTLLTRGVVGGLRQVAAVFVAVAVQLAFDRRRAAVQLVGDGAYRAAHLLITGRTGWSTSSAQGDRDALADPCTQRYTVTRPTATSRSSPSQYEKTAASGPANSHHDHSDGKRNSTKLNLDADTRRGQRRAMPQPLTESAQAVAYGEALLIYIRLSSQEAPWWCHQAFYWRAHRGGNRR